MSLYRYLRSVQPRDVPRAITAAVVGGSVLIIIMDGFFSQVRAASAYTHGMTHTLHHAAGLARVHLVCAVDGLHHQVAAHLYSLQRDNQMSRGQHRVITYPEPAVRAGCHVLLDVLLALKQLFQEDAIFGLAARVSSINLRFLFSFSDHSIHATRGRK